MILGVLLPHTKLYGGVKRFLELGNIFVEQGHRFIVFTPDGKGPDWFDFKGEMSTFDKIKGTKLDALWTTTVKMMPMVLESDARHKIFYHVRKSDNVAKLMKNPEVEVFACSSNVYEYDLKKFGRESFKAIGGVTVANYKPKESYEVKDRPFVVMAYGRIVERVKGTHYVVSACEKLYAQGYNIKLLLYDTPVDEGAARRIKEFTCKCPLRVCRRPSLRPQLGALQPCRLLCVGREPALHRMEQHRGRGNGVRRARDSHQGRHARPAARQGERHTLGTLALLLQTPHQGALPKRGAEKEIWRGRTAHHTRLRLERSGKKDN